MNLPIALRLLVGLGLLGASCASTPGPEDLPRPALEPPYRVLLLGDSISIGYTDEVRELLAGEAVVLRPMRPDGTSAENCQGTTHGVANVERWLAADGGDWDVIHYNFGLHDLKRVQPDTGANSNDPSHPHQASPSTYEEQLGAIAAALRATGARLVFATTTPVPEGGVRPHRDPADVEVYNAIGERIAAEVGAEVDDLYAFCLPRLAEIQQPVNVHFKPEGSSLLAAEVAAAIRRAAGPGVPAN